MSSFNYLTEATKSLPDASEMRIGIIYTEWNAHITNRLTESAVRALRKAGVEENNITLRTVPGSMELVFAAQQMAQYGHVNAVIVIGTVIRGETPHFDYICQGVTQGIAQLNATGNVPVIFGVLTVNNEEQAMARCGGTAGDKGEEFALTAIKMVDFAWQFQK